MPGAVWAARAGAWVLDERVVHLRDPLPSTRDLVIMLLSDYSWRLLLGTMRDTADQAWLFNAVRTGALRPRTIDTIADGLAKTLFAQERWAVQRIWKETLGLWREVDAELIGRGVDVMTMAPDRATNAVYGVLYHRHAAGSRDALNRWIKSLVDPPARVLTADTGIEGAAAEWLAAAARLHGGAPPTLMTPAGVDSEITFT